MKCVAPIWQLSTPFRSRREDYLELKLLNEDPNPKAANVWSKSSSWFEVLKDMAVSENNGTPKWMVKIMENPIKMGWFGGNNHESIPFRSVDQNLIRILQQLLPQGDSEWKPVAVAAVHLSPHIPWVDPDKRLELSLKDKNAVDFKKTR